MPILAGTTRDLGKGLAGSLGDGYIGRGLSWWLLLLPREEGHSSGPGSYEGRYGWFLWGRILVERRSTGGFWVIIPNDYY